MDVSEFREERRKLFLDSACAGVDLVRTLSVLTLQFVRSQATVLHEWPVGWSLVAVGGTGRGEICPGSDIDLLILHPKRTSPKAAARVSEGVWYPIWDAGLKGTPAVHTIDSAVSLGDREVLSAVSWLSAVHLVGDAEVTAAFTLQCTQRWRERSRTQLRALFDTTRERHIRAGEVSFHLEPELRDGRGGLRDLHVLDYIVASEHPAVTRCLERPLAELLSGRDELLATRAELHRVANRNGDRLLLQEQDAVATARGLSSADELMARVAEAGRDIAWATEETIRRLDHELGLPSARARPTRTTKLTADIGMVDDELVVLDDAAIATDATLVLRLGALAAQENLPIARSTLVALAASSPPLGSPWPERARNALVALLGAGQQGTHVLEALDRYDLVTRFFPEWAAVRFKPQRNAYHRFTVDRHLCEAAAQAAELVRTVTRPDLLLVGTWLHDIGKGFPGDHTDVGVDMLADIGARMGFSADDVAVLQSLCRHHLLLPEVATRRDLSDPGVINSVAAAVVDVETLHLLRALTEADSLATGPTAWSDWKERLVEDLERRVESVLQGNRLETARVRTQDHDDLLEQAKTSGSVVVRVQRESVDVEAVAVAAPDKTGLFSVLAGALTMVGADVLSADVWTTDDGYALDVFRVTRQLGGETNWRKLETLIEGALDGSVDIDAELQRRAKTYRRSRMKSAGHAAPPSVVVDDETPELATTVEVRAPDGPAVLYRVARAISGLGLDLRTAKVATIGHEVVDSFAVRRIDAQGRKTKLADPALEEEVRGAVLAALQ